MSNQILLQTNDFCTDNVLIICSGNTETNPGPKKNTKISLCHWNLNGIVAHNFSKVSLPQDMAIT